MGYYADGYGEIVIDSALKDEEISTVLDLLRDGFEDAGFLGAHNPTQVEFYVSTCDKYWEDDVRSSLNKLSNGFPVYSGYVDFVGEDHCLWRFLYKDGIWAEENGKIVYESDPGYSCPLAPIPVNKYSADDEEFDADSVDPLSILTN